jgi:hypothetical protein
MRKFRAPVLPVGCVGKGKGFIAREGAPAHGTSDDKLRCDQKRNCQEGTVPAEQNVSTSPQGICTDAWHGSRSPVEASVVLTVNLGGAVSRKTFMWGETEYGQMVE